MRTIKRQILLDVLLLSKLSSFYYLLFLYIQRILSLSLNYISNWLTEPGYDNCCLTFKLKISLLLSIHTYILYTHFRNKFDTWKGGVKRRKSTICWWRILWDHVWNYVHVFFSRISRKSVYKRNTGTEISIVCLE